MLRARAQGAVPAIRKRPRSKHEGRVERMTVWREPALARSWPRLTCAWIIRTRPRPRAVPSPPAVPSPRAVPS
eukprot:359155-Chlamydomonas_euryale.AAC.10